MFVAMLLSARLVTDKLRSLSDVSGDVDVAICALGDAAEPIPWSRDM